MTREEVNRHINQIPKLIREQYDLEPLYDLSDKPYEPIAHGNETYRYYPEIPAVLIGAKLVKWETDENITQKVDIANPEHFEEILRRGCQNQYDEDLVGIMDKTPSGHLTMELTWADCIGSEYTKSFPIDDTFIYYNPDRFSIVRLDKKKQIAAALFLAKRYKRAFMVPFKGEEPGEWGDYD